jgi:very-short-patch-repair endonuclease
VLEIAYLRDVEQAHGLPRGERQVPVRGARGRIYLDLRYRRYRTRVELDGRAAHPEHLHLRDMHRDNDAVRAGDAPLRYGTADVTERPCQVAQEVGGVLTDHGWAGKLRPCGREGCVSA